MPSSAVAEINQQTWFERLVSRIPKRDWVVVGWVLGVKLALLVFAAKSFQIFQNERVVGLYRTFTIWDRWDSLHYLKLAEAGYSSTDTVKSWFYPLFPWLVRIVAFCTHDYLISGFIVSGIAGLAAALVFRRLVELDYPAAVALRSVWFFLIFPTAHFFHIAYTEALFLAMAIGSIYAARINRWAWAGILGALAFATRANGIVLIPTLGVEALHQLYVRRRWDWRWLWIAAVPLGFGVYLFVNWKVTGDPFWFLRVRQKLFAMHFAWPWVGIREAILNFHRSPTDAEIVGAQELYFAILSLGCAIISWIKLRPAYAMWITANYLLITCISFLESMPRYALTFFPIFMLFGLLSANRFWRGLLTVASILFLAAFATLFVRGWWAF
ncbi:MAG TPA: mannosyltransferase family protein [Chthoniobacterales bacterium]|jgi:hypothetical protein